MEYLKRGGVRRVEGGEERNTFSQPIREEAKEEEESEKGSGQHKVMNARRKGETG